MSNDKMVKNRYGRWAAARKRINWIVTQLSDGKTVYVVTHMNATAYTLKHVAMFKATNTGAYVQRGRGWDCIDFCGLRAV